MRYSNQLQEKQNIILEGIKTQLEISNSFKEAHSQCFQYEYLVDDGSNKTNNNK